jgi:hypothetical protein
MTNFTQSEKTMLSRIVIEMAENNIKPNQENIKLTFKKIIERDKETLEQKADKVAKILTPAIWARVQKKQ